MARRVGRRDARGKGQAVTDLYSNDFADGPSFRADGGASGHIRAIPLPQGDPNDIPHRCDVCDRVIYSGARCLECQQKEEKEN